MWNLLVHFVFKTDNFNCANWNLCQPSLCFAIIKLPCFSFKFRISIFFSFFSLLFHFPIILVSNPLNYFLFFFTRLLLIVTGKYVLVVVLKLFTLECSSQLLKTWNGISNVNQTLALVLKGLTRRLASRMNYLLEGTLRLRKQLVNFLVDPVSLTWKCLMMWFCKKNCKIYS